MSRAGLDEEEMGSSEDFLLEREARELVATIRRKHTSVGYEELAVILCDLLDLYVIFARPGQLLSSTGVTCAKNAAHHRTYTTTRRTFFSSCCRMPTITSTTVTRFRH